MTEHERKEYIKNKYKQRKAIKKQNHLEKEENEPRSPTIKWNVSSDKAVPNTSKIDVIEKKTEEFNTEPYENIRNKDTYEDICNTFMQNSEESANLPNLCFDANSMKLKGGGTEKFKLKTFKSTNLAINSVLNALRSSSMFEPLNMHKKCPLTSDKWCNFCLLRSPISKINSPKGKQEIIPVEVEVQPISNEENLYQVLQTIFINAARSYSLFSSTFVPELKCSCCMKICSNTSEHIIELNNENTNREIGNLVQDKFDSIKDGHAKEAIHDNNFNLKIQSGIKSIIFHSLEKMSVNLQSTIQFGGKSWQCVGAISDTYESFFKIGNKWFSNSCELSSIDFLLSNISIAVFDQVNERKYNENENFSYIGADLIKIRNKTTARKKSVKESQNKYEQTEARKQAKKEYEETEVRKQHSAKQLQQAMKKSQNEYEETEAGKQRKKEYEQTEAGKQRKKEYEQTEARKQAKKEYYRNKKEEEFLSDTGMDSVCACCIELKSTKSCTSISKIPEEKVYKYCIESDLTRNKNGNFYVCNTCKLSIMKDVEPRRSQKEILGLLEFPEEFMEELEQCCTRSLKEINDPEKKYLKLNRVEDYLLKPVIPFIRIGHLPRGRYFQLKGDLIMVSADVEETMNKILPRSQNLLPVAFKRKIEYHGHFMAEFIDRRKVQSYFKWFQQHNHLFKEFSLDEDLIDKFEQEAQEEVEEIDVRKNNLMTDHDTTSLSFN